MYGAANKALTFPEVRMHRSFCSYPVSPLHPHRTAPRHTLFHSKSIPHSLSLKIRSLSHHRCALTDPLKEADSSPPSSCPGMNPRQVWAEANTSEEARRTGRKDPPRAPRKDSAAEAEEEAWHRGRQEKGEVRHTGHKDPLRAARKGRCRAWRGPREEWRRGQRRAPRHGRQLPQPSRQSQARKSWHTPRRQTPPRLSSPRRSASLEQREWPRAWSR